MGEKNEIIKHEAQNLDIKFPHNSKLTAKRPKFVSQKAINETGIIDSKGKAYIGKKKIKDILVTDKAGANKFYNNLDDEDKFENGDEKYASVAACQKEITNKIQQDRPQLEREKLKHSRDCMNAFIESPELEKERSINSDRIQKELPTLTKKKIKAENITCDQLTGEEFEDDAEGHHMTRKKDDPSNIIVVKSKTHDAIHKAEANSAETLKELAKEKAGTKKTLVSCFVRRNVQLFMFI